MDDRCKSTRTRTCVLKELPPDSDDSSDITSSLSGSDYVPSDVPSEDIFDENKNERLVQTQICFKAVAREDILEDNQNEKVVHETESAGKKHIDELVNNDSNDELSEVTDESDDEDRIQQFEKGKA